MATLTGGALGDAGVYAATEDTLFGGRVVLFQPPRGKGYRTNVDALLLAAFAAAGPHAEVAYDLGAGVGAIGLSLLRLRSADQVVFVEVDPVPAAMARRNLDANDWADRGEVLCADVGNVSRTRRGAASLVVCNPPYVAPGRGRIPCADAGARVGNVTIFVEAARQLAGRRARVCFVYPAHELAPLLAAMAREGLHAKRLRMVHATPASPARVALLEARAGRPGGLEVTAPLVERQAGAYTPEMQAILARD